MWADWPDAWGPDAGIDLVAEENDGDLWAIQAKAYDPSYAIKKADVDSFLAESSRPQFSYRLLIATTDHLGPTARRTLDLSVSRSATCFAPSLNSPRWPGPIHRMFCDRVARRERNHFSTSGRRSGTRSRALARRIAASC